MEMKIGIKENLGTEAGDEKKQGINRRKKERKNRRFAIDDKTAKIWKWTKLTMVAFFV